MVTARVIALTNSFKEYRWLDLTESSIRILRGWSWIHRRHQKIMALLISLKHYKKAKYKILQGFRILATKLEQYQLKIILLRFMWILYQTTQCLAGDNPQLQGIIKNPFKNRLTLKNRNRLLKTFELHTINWQNKSLRMYLWTINLLMKRISPVKMLWLLMRRMFMSSRKTRIWSIFSNRWHQ